jgi:hypothetical protein
VTENDTTVTSDVRLEYVDNREKIRESIATLKNIIKELDNIQGSSTLIELIVDKILGVIRRLERS